MSDKVYNPYIAPNENNEQVIFNTMINTNISDYSIEDIFNLLDINIEENSDYDVIVKEINEKINNYITFFDKTKNKEVVDFFNNVRISLLGEIENNKNSNKSDAELLLLSQEKVLDAEKNRGLKTNSTDTTNKDLYNSKSGAGNPINRKTITKLLNIDSRFRNNYDITTSTDYKIDLPYELNNIIEMKLSDLEFPSTYYPFNDEYENNYFWIRFLQGNGAQVFLYIYIPSGNYYHSSFIKYIQDEFTRLGVDLTINFNLTYENTGGIGVGDGKVTIGVNSETNITSISEIELNFEGKKLPDESIYNNSQKYLLDFIEQREIINNYYYQKSTLDYKTRIGWMLGYRKPVYNNSDSHSSEGILDILGPKYLYLILDDFNTSNNTNFFNSSEKTMLNDNIIARISIKGYAFSIQSQTDLSIYSEPRYYYGPVNINKLRVRLIDEYGRTLNLNNMDFSFTLSLISIYSQD